MTFSQTMKQITHLSLNAVDKCVIVLSMQYDINIRIQHDKSLQVN